MVRAEVRAITVMRVKDLNLNHHVVELLTQYITVAPTHFELCWKIGFYET